MSLTPVRFTCPFCSLFCSDILITGIDNGYPVLQPGCAKANAGIRRTLQKVDLPLVSGKSTSWEHAVEETVRKLRSSHQPLVLLTGELSREEASAAVILAQKAGACIDTFASTLNTAWMLGTCSPGVRTCSAEAITGRAVLAWGVDFDRNAPRFFDLFTTREEAKLFSINSFLPNQVAAVSLNSPGSDLEFLLDLNRALRKLTASPIAAQLAKELVKAGSGCILADVDPSLTINGWYLAELSRLAINLEEATGELWDFFPIFPASNWNGVQVALEVITGFPGGIRFALAEDDQAEAVIEYSPTDLDAEKLIKRNEIDLLIVAGGENWVDIPRDEAYPTERVVLSASPPIQETDVWLPVAKAGIHTGGTALRFDGALVSLSPIIENNRPTASEILKKLAEAV